MTRMVESSSYVAFCKIIAVPSDVLHMCLTVGKGTFLNDRLIERAALASKIWL